MTNDDELKGHNFYWKLTKSMKFFGILKAKPEHVPNELAELPRGALT